MKVVGEEADGGAARAAMIGSVGSTPAEAERSANAPSAVSTTPAARPSSPSIRLIALMIRTIQPTVSGSASHPRSTMPHGMSSRSRRSPSAKASTAATTCQKSFTSAGMPRTSSMTPTTTRSAAPARIAGARFGRRLPIAFRSFAPAREASATAKAIAIATPPSRGTGNSWIFRSASGWSSRPYRMAKRRTSGVTARLTTNATAEVRAVSIGHRW